MTWTNDVITHVDTIRPITVPRCLYSVMISNPVLGLPKRPIIIGSLIDLDLPIARFTIHERIFQC